MAKLLQNREQNIEHVGIYIAEHRTQFPCIAGALEHHIAGVKHRSVWLGLMLNAPRPSEVQKCKHEPAKWIMKRALEGDLQL